MAAIHDSPTPNPTINFRGCLIQPKPPQSGVRFGQPPYKGGCLGDQPTKKGPFSSGGKQPPHGCLLWRLATMGCLFGLVRSAKGSLVWLSRTPMGAFGCYS
ncbi:hypothetical protein Tco_0124022, partial [Tanacetum coccineum]